MGEQRTHKRRQVMDYVMGNADRPLSLEEINRDVQWNISSISTACSKMMQLYPEHMQRISRGMYRWNSAIQVNAIASDAVPVIKEMIISIVTRRDDKILVRDEESGDLFVMQPFEF